MSPYQPGPKAGRREWIGLAVIALPCLLYAMDLTVLNLAVPSLSADLKPGAVQLLWIVDIYGFMVSGFLVTMGTLGDRIGRRRLLLIGAAAFGVASVAAAFSNSPGMLIATRALLGVAGATLAPSTLSLLRTMFNDPSQRTFAIGVWITSYSVGGAIGPLLGGVLLQYFWWGSVFLLGVPVMLLLLVVGPVLLPEYRDPKAGRLDLTSVGLSLASILAVIYGLKHLAQDGIGWMSAAAVAGGLVVGVGFVRRQGRLASPLVDLRLFRRPAFSVSLVTYMMATFVVFGVFIFTSQYLQLVLGLSPLEAGLATAPWPLGFVVGSMVTPRLARRFPPATLMAGGLVIATVGFALLAGVGGGAGLALFIVSSVIFSLGLAPVFTLATDTIVGSAPPERAGAAAAISETGSELGGALGIALLGSLGTALYRGAISDSIPNGLLPEAAEAARGTLGGALATAATLPESEGGALAEVAREAFAHSLQVNALICAAVVIVLAVVAWVMLKRPRGVDANAGIEAEFHCRS